MELRDGDKILLIRFSALGDMVHVLPALRLLRESRPGVEIHWLTEDRFARMIENHPDLNGTYVFRRKEISSMWVNPLRWPTAARTVSATIRDIRKAGFDWVIDFQGNAKSAMFVRASGIRSRIGFARGFCRELNYLSSNTHVRPPGGRIHRIERNLSLLGPLGIQPNYMPPRFAAWEGDAESVGRAWAELAGGSPSVVMMHPGTSAFGAFKRWPAERFGALAERLKADFGAAILVSHGPGEDDIAATVARISRGAARPLPHGTSLTALAEWLSRCSLFVGCDTGPMHIAAGLGIPVVAIFGPKDPVIYGPYGTKSKVVNCGAKCAPCDKRECDDPYCMTDIAIDDVYAACAALLAKQD